MSNQEQRPVRPDMSGRFIVHGQARMPMPNPFGPNMIPRPGVGAGRVGFPFIGRGPPIPMPGFQEINS